MIQNNNSFLYLVIGDNKKIFKELIYSLISLNHISKKKTKENAKVFIYTDQELEIPEQLSELNIIIKPINKEKYNYWLNKGNGFFLIIKAWLLKEHFENYPNTNLLFIDTDTCFIEDPYYLFNQIEQGKLVLHLKEHRLKIRTEISEYIKTKEFISTTGSPYKISLSDYMWNSGIIGINSLKSKIIDEIINLIEQIVKEKNWHVTEQLAFSYFFQTLGKPIASEKSVIHYHFCKQFIYLMAIYFKHIYPEDKNITAYLSEGNSFISSLNIKQLPAVLIQLTKEIFIWERMYYDFPINTIIGKNLYKQTIFDKRYFRFALKTFFKKLFGINKISEFVSKPVQSNESIINDPIAQD